MHSSIYPSAHVMADLLEAAVRPVVAIVNRRRDGGTIDYSLARLIEGFKLRRRVEALVDIHSEFSQRGRAGYSYEAGLGPVYSTWLTKEPAGLHDGPATVAALRAMGVL
jgi:hypothetical protein